MENATRPQGPQRATQGLRATPEQLCDALQATATLEPAQGQILRLYLERLELLDKQIESLEKSAAETMRGHQEAVGRLAEVPGLGAESALQIIADHWRRTKTALILDKLTRTAIDRVNGPEAAPSPRRHIWHRGLAVAREERKARVYLPATALPKATSNCGACWRRRPTRRSKPKEVSSNSSTGGWSKEWGTHGPSGPWRTVSAESFGRYSTTECIIGNSVCAPTPLRCTDVLPA